MQLIHTAYFGKSIKLFSSYTEANSSWSFVLSHCIVVLAWNFSMTIIVFTISLVSRLVQSDRKLSQQAINNGKQISGCLSWIETGERTQSMIETYRNHN